MLTSHNFASLWINSYLFKTLITFSVCKFLKLYIQACNDAINVFKWIWRNVCTFIFRVVALPFLFRRDYLRLSAWIMSRASQRSGRYIRHKEWRQFTGRKALMPCCCLHFWSLYGKPPYKVEYSHSLFRNVLCCRTCVILTFTLFKSLS